MRVACSAVVLAAIATSACSPVSNLRPASGLLDDRRFELGTAGSIIGPRPYVDEPTTGAAQLWFSGRATKALTLTGIASREPGSFAAGGAAQIRVLKTDRLALAPEVELGFVWAALNAGGAVRLVGQTWIYAAPRVGSRGSTWSLEVPAGISIHVVDGVQLRAEYRVSWANELSYYQQRRIFAAGLAVQF